LNLTSGSFGAVKISDIIISCVLMSVANNYFFFAVSLLYMPRDEKATYFPNFFTRSSISPTTSSLSTTS
jgi:hypothetical protein